MTWSVGRFSRLLVLSAAIGCFVLAITWPQWRADLRAQYHYGYGYGPTPLDHYKCYEAKPEEKVGRRDVHLQDQFEARATTVRRPRLICNPVVKDGTFPDQLSNPIAHLVCYEIVKGDREGHERRKEGHERREVLVDNQFGNGQPLRVTEAELLCVPSFKTLR